ncbi:MAG: DUF2384 domain-containing protein [Candidatus Eremiobacteraeota bacterium]|nr:DUF2384 domain-containing protein [Candidatus Eremiobacteraeota bacterium]
MVATIEAPTNTAKVAVQAARYIADAWKLRRPDLAALLDVKPSTLRHWGDEPPALRDSILERVSHLIGIYDDLHRLFGDHPYADEWIRVRNAAFGDRTPLSLMTHGFTELVRVRDYLENAIAY